MKNGLIILLLFISMSLTAQEFTPDASIWKDPWVSCNTSPNPNAIYGNTHWVRYDLGVQRNLSKSWVWNINDPERLDLGFREVRVDYSLDGVTWVHHESMTFPKAEGEAVYGGFPGPDLTGVKARYILITGLSSHGNSTCAGFSDIKFNLMLPGEPEETDLVTSLEEEVKEKGLVIYPNPAQETVNLLTNYTGESRLLVVSMAGKLVYEDEVFTRAGEPLRLETEELGRGSYLVVLTNDEFRKVKPLLVR